MFVVNLPYYINKSIIIHVFYCPWHQHCIIWVMDMRQNISSGVSKSLFWKFRIKVECTSAVIFLWDTTKVVSHKNINKEIIIHVFNNPWHQNCIIWVMDMRQNISSGIRKNVSWKIIIKLRYISDMILLRDITNNKNNKTKLLY